MHTSNFERIQNDSLNEGRAALARGAWREARAWFETALREQETPEALEGLGLAAWWTSDAAVRFDARERAYQLYRRFGNARAAARVAACLAMDHFYYRGEYAIASGWVQRAHRLLEGLEPGSEPGWLAIVEAHITLWVDHDFVTAQRLCAQALLLGKSLRDIDLEMSALATEGLALVAQGMIKQGMRRLDEATLAAIAGEMMDVDAACTACCCLIFACEWTRDYARAAQWIERMRELAIRWAHPTLLSFCRIHYASLLIRRGAWSEAETELLDATTELETSQPARAAEGFVRLAELRCWQGHFDEASALLERIESPPFKALAGDFSLCIRAALALAQNDPQTAVDMAERFLRAIPKEDRMERVSGLELLVQALVLCGNCQQAAVVLSELKAAVAGVATKPMQASLYFADGLMATATANYEIAKCCFEDAVELWTRAGVPFETARARIELARSYLALGRIQAAGQQAQRAFDALEQLGALPDCARAAALLRQIESTAHQSTHQEEIANPNGTAALTAREVEVLRLIAAGKSNQEIARQLVISVRTTERHISNIYVKIGAEGKAARAIATAYALRHGLTNIGPAS
jgi:ATP/maltotriose-dependent transcriptional regulator MalT